MEWELLVVCVEELRRGLKDTPMEIITAGAEVWGSLLLYPIIRCLSIVKASFGSPTGPLDKERVLLSGDPFLITIMMITGSPLRTIHLTYCTSLAYNRYNFRLTPTKTNAGIL